MKHKTWMMPLAAIAAVALTPSADGLAGDAARGGATLVLANYPGDAPGTQSIDTIAKSTTCQDEGYLRYSRSVHHCVDK